MATNFVNLPLRPGRSGGRGDYVHQVSIADGDTLIVAIPPGIEPTVGVFPAASATATVSATNSPISGVDAGTASYHAWTPGDIVNPATEMQSIYGSITAVKISAAGGAVVATVTG